MTLFIESVNDSDLNTLEAGLRATKHEAKHGVHAIEREKRRRAGILLAATEMDVVGLDTGVIDALADTEGMVNPEHSDSLWADWMQPRPKPEWPKLQDFEDD